MSRQFDFENFKVLWGTMVRQESFDLDSFPSISEPSSEPMLSVPELRDFGKQIVTWAKDFAEKTTLDPVIASSWISKFDPNSNGMNIHTDEDHGGTVSAVVWFEGEEDQGGDLVLWDPRWENPKLWGGVKGDGKYTIKFKPGTVVMFPSSVWHGVTAYTGSKPRRAINMVLTFKDVVEIAQGEVANAKLMDLAKQLDTSYDGSNASLLDLIETIKTKI